MTKEKNLVSIKKRVTKFTAMDRKIVDEIYLEVVGDNLNEVEKVFDKKWEHI